MKNIKEFNLYTFLLCTLSVAFVIVFSLLSSISEKISASTRDSNRQMLISAIEAGPIYFAKNESAEYAQEQLEILLNNSRVSEIGLVSAQISGGSSGDDLFAYWNSKEKTIDSCIDTITKKIILKEALYAFNIKLQFNNCFNLNSDLIIKKSFSKSFITLFIIVIVFLIIAFYPIISSIRRSVTLISNKTQEKNLQLKNISFIPLRNLTELALDGLKLEKQEVMINLARQVAHDIRSPLTALDMVMSKSQSLPEDERKIVRHAVRRIHDIANNLLIQNKKSVSSNEEIIKPEMLAPIIESIVSEKRTEYNSLIGVNLKVSINSNNFHLFSKINPSELKRILSNLINNSIESFPKNTGEISVDFFEKDQFIHISISDNGPGIPSHVIEKLFSQDFQSTKNKGSGIGLKSAKEFLNKIDGDLILDSSSNGTKVTIKLPVVDSPSWFLNSLEIKSNSKITIIDDDKSIHALWEQRLKQVSRKSQITHLSNFEIIEAKQDLFLVDFEFQGESFNGLDKIIEMNLEHAVLVTSHYDELEIQTKCLEHKIKIIPKEVAHLIPISEIKDNQSVNMILIDDDELIRLSWEMKAQMAGKSIKTFSNFNDFKNLMPQIDPSSEIFIDSELNADLKGEEVAKILFEQGFKSIHLCTGYSPEDFAPMPWIKSIRGKAFPT
jgi:signal transduction histidine kinase